MSQWHIDCGFQFQRFIDADVQHGAKRSLKQLTQSNSRYEQVQCDLRKLGEEQKERDERLTEFRAQHQTLSVESESARAVITELQQRPEMRDAKRLDDLNKWFKKTRAR